MSVLIAFVCTGLLFYWVSRTRLLLRAEAGEIEEVLEGDLWFGRKLWIAFKAMFVAPNQFTH